MTVTSSRDGAPHGANEGGRSTRAAPIEALRGGSEGSNGAAGSTRLRLLGRFELTIDGVPRTVPIAGRTVLALVALAERPVPVSDAAATLWPATDPGWAPERLRYAMESLERAGLDLVDERDGMLSLCPNVRVDVAESLATAAWISSMPAAVAVPLDEVAAEVRRWGDLLPGWSDDHILIERERVRRIRLRALEELAERSLRDGRARDAIEAASAAVEAEPLRERAWSALIRAHLAAGDAPGAIRRYAAFHRLLFGELRRVPSIDLEDLVPPLTVALTT